MFEPTQEDSLTYSDRGMANVSLLDDDEDDSSESAGLVSGSENNSEGVPNSRRVDRYLTLRERLERLKQQAAAKIKSFADDVKSTPRQEGEGGRFTYQEIQKAVEESIVKMTDPLYSDLDFESTLTFVDDIKSWTGGMPQMLPIVVSSIDKRLRNEDPHITYLTLCLLDALVKNTSQRFHSCVATQPIMSSIARVARGSAHKVKLYTGDLRRDSKVMWQKLSSLTSDSGSSVDSHASARQRERNAIAARTKAKEAIKSWGEGFVQTQASVPLFASTYQTLLNEGMDFGDCNVEGTIVLDAPDEFASAAIDSSSGGNTPDISELIDSSHQTAKLLLEVCGSADGSDDGGLAAVLVDQCYAQQAQLASHIEFSIASNNEAQLISVLAANEALQEALTHAEGKRGAGTPSSVSPATSTSTSEFESTMADVDSLLFEADSLAVADAAAAAPVTADLLDLDFLTPAAAPPVAPPVIPPPATATLAPPVAPPVIPPPATATLAPPVAPPVIPPSSTATLAPL